MATVILVNYIHYDGIGDFQHLLDITKEIYPLALQSGIEVIPLVLCLSNLEESVKKRLNNLNMDLKTFIFTMEKKHPSLEELNQQFSEFVASEVELQRNLKNALIIIQISTATTKYQKDTLLRYCYPDIPIVNISEHAGLRTTASFHPFPRDFDERDKVTNEKNINDRWMGIAESLGKGALRYGIKLHSPLKISKEEALLTFTDQCYVRTLLKKESSQLIEKEELTDFINRTQIITAYLQEESSIIKFILYCLEHEKNSGKDILFHINSNPIFDPKLCYMHDVGELDNYFFSSMKNREDQFVVPKLESVLIKDGFQKYNFDNVEINVEVNVNGAIRIIRFGFSPTVKKTVRILAGFCLEDGDYNKLYHLADSIVGVCGDNTLEKALSHNKLPFLQSDNKYTFESAMHALYHIGLESLPHASLQLKQYFSNYFLNKNMRLDDASRREEILQTDWNEMHTAWAVVGDYLRKNHNFYNHLKNIFYEALLHASAQRGDVELLTIIYKNVPAINIALPNKIGQTALELATRGNHTSYLNEFSMLFEQLSDSMETQSKDEKSKSRPLSEQKDSFFFQNRSEFLQETNDKQPQSVMSGNRELC
ncbi:hypothetical protein [Legionella fallonii]|uniref:Uncharacterized protein n=1 Tax=Legionella fallonii LLAP-10 TaxID=1212491 RepID=A0A098G474_9GAMM|nr:hypothetical protein [Legionella fallonii]CEG56776.1 protein of unknown function [Legionella fallonii LLAP-10]